MKWSEEQKEYLKEITPGHHYREIQELMNKRFGLEYTMDQIKGAIGRYKLNTGFTGQIQKGNIPWNKGTKGLVTGGVETQFKKGNRPKNFRPVGSERINVDGYTEIKVADPNKWRLKHQVVWEENKGPIPKGYTVIFGDSNKQNFDINNLLLVTRHQLLVLNRNKLIQNDTDITKTGILVADLNIKISELKKKGKG